MGITDRKLPILINIHSTRVRVRVHCWVLYSWTSCLGRSTNLCQCYWYVPWSEPRDTVQTCVVIADISISFGLGLMLVNTLFGNPVSWYKLVSSVFLANAFFRAFVTIKTDRVKFAGKFPVYKHYVMVQNCVFGFAKLIIYTHLEPCATVQTSFIGVISKCTFSELFVMVQTYVISVSVSDLSGTVFIDGENSLSEFSIMMTLISFHLLNLFPWYTPIQLML